MKQSLIFRFTLVNHFTLEYVDEVIALGHDLKKAESNMRLLFPVSLFDIIDVQCIKNSKFVMCGTSNYDSLNLLSHVS